MKLFMGALLAVGAVFFVAFGVRFMASTIPGAQVTSWFRSPWKNQEVGGLSKSAHLLGWAVDLVPVTREVEDRAKTLYPVVVNEGDHIHAALYRA